jgi:STE24 endopeptidase
MSAALILVVVCTIGLLASALALPSASPAGDVVSDRVTINGSSADPSDPRSYFTEEEMSAWKRYRMKRLWIHLIALGSVLIFYSILILPGLNGTLKRVAEGAARWCYTHPALLRIGKRFPFLARVVKIPERLFGGRQWLEVLFYCVFFLFLIRLFFFPEQFYRSYWFDRQYGLSNYSLSLWIFDYVKALCLGTLLFSLMVFGIYGLIRRVPRWWWLLLWGGVSIAIFGYVAIAPYGEHIYSNFQPLERGELRDRLESLADREGLELEDILVVDASRRTKKVNAYLSGSGPSKRIVLFDTLVEAFTPREITMILAHELAHWKDPDDKRSYAIFSLTVFCVLALASSVLKWGTRIRRLHYSSPTDVAGLPVLFLTFFVVFQVLHPVNLAIKRAREAEADRQSIELVCDPEAFITTHVKLARLNHSYVDPPPLYVILFSSHPPFLKRIQTALNSDCS